MKNFTIMLIVFFSFISVSFASAVAEPFNNLDNIYLFGGLLIAGLELALRIIPTKKDLSILDNLLIFLNLLVPNRAKLDYRAPYLQKKYGIFRINKNK
jgi:hypothetical protein